MLDILRNCQIALPSGSAVYIPTSDVKCSNISMSSPTLLLSFSLQNTPTRPPATTTRSSIFWLQLGVLMILKVSLCTLALNWISEKEFGWSRKNSCQLKRCAMWELGVKFYWGQNEDCRLGDSTSDSLRDWPKEAFGESQFIRFWWRGSPVQSKEGVQCNQTLTLQKVFC